MLIVEPQYAISKWLCERIGYIPTKEFIAFANWDNEREEIIGALGYDGWSTKMVEIHVAGEEGTYWLNKETLSMAFIFPFVMHKRNIVVSRVSSYNLEAMTLNEKLGFEEQCRIKDGAEFGDLVVFAMYKERCKWLNMKTKFREAA